MDISDCIYGDFAAGLLHPFFDQVAPNTVFFGKGKSCAPSFWDCAHFSELLEARD
jgi:hypothetical protein